MEWCAAGRRPEEAVNEGEHIAGKGRRARIFLFVLSRPPSHASHLPFLLLPCSPQSDGADPGL